MKHVWMNETGQFLVLGERQSFAPGGRSPHTSFTHDLNQASVLHFLPKGFDATGLIKVEAREERKVFLIGAAE